MSTVSKKVQQLTTDYVHQIFRNLEAGDGKGFFEHVADNVDWIVEGTHPLSFHVVDSVNGTASTTLNVTVASSSTICRTVLSTPTTAPNGRSLSLVKRRRP